MEPNTTPTGFEPARVEPNGFQVHRLNHSAIVSSQLYYYTIVLVGFEPTTSAL
jgi:hypothetical protein